MFGSPYCALGSAAINVADDTVARTQELIASYLQTRANQLIRSQPSLTPFLTLTGKGKFDLGVTRGEGSFDFATRSEYPIWARASGSWTTDGNRKSQYAFGALGAHEFINENFLLGAMLQFDHLKEETGAASVSGTGWLIGPYFVAKSASYPLYVEGRFLYGETNNKISPFGTYEDHFDTTRLLAQFKVAGELNYGMTTLNPFLDASFTTDYQKSYVDGLGNTIPKQGIELGQIELGVDFNRMLSVNNGSLELFGSVSGIWSNTSGSGFASTITPDYEGGRARIELGLDRKLSGYQRIRVAAYYDGIGASGFESFGLSLGYEVQF